MNNIVIFAGKFLGLISRIILYIGLIVLTPYLAAKVLEFILIIYMKPSTANDYANIDASMGYFGAVVLAIAAIFFHKKLFPKNHTSPESSNQES